MLLANTPAKAETQLHSLERAARGIGLHLDAHKTEYICFNQRDDILILNGSSLKLVLYCHLQHHNDTINKQTQEDFFNKYVPLTLFVRFEKVIQGFTVRGSWRPNRTEIFWPPLFWPSTLCLSRSPDAQPEALGPLCWVLVFFTASYQQLLWSPNSIGVPEGLLARVWLSLPHLVYNSVSSSNCNCLDFCLDWVI